MNWNVIRMDKEKKEFLVLALILNIEGLLGIITYYIFPFDIGLLFYSVLFIVAPCVNILLPISPARKYRRFTSTETKILMGFMYGFGAFILNIYLSFVQPITIQYFLSGIFLMVICLSLGVYGTWLYLKRKRKRGS